jgi:hypothetical protein
VEIFFGEAFFYDTMVFFFCSSSLGGSCKEDYHGGLVSQAPAVG